MRPVFSKTVKRKLAPPLFLIPFSKNSGGNWLPECGASLFQVSTLKNHLWYLNLTQSSEEPHVFHSKSEGLYWYIVRVGNLMPLQHSQEEKIRICLLALDRDHPPAKLRQRARVWNPHDEGDIFLIALSWLCKISGLGRVCGLWFTATAAVAASAASRLGGEGGQPGSHLLCQPQQPLNAVEKALQHVCLILSALPSFFSNRDSG